MLMNDTTKKYNEKELVDELKKQFDAYEFAVLSEGVENKLYIISPGRDDFKTTITLEFPLTQGQVDSIIGILDGTIQILKYHDVI
jgi:hypothetical protein